ncbi:MAG TPA: PilZ domain-containing protein [Sedimenticola sp.]|nr:PilZ domain-containing protein [Sedimenticola sp.]
MNDAQNMERLPEEERRQYFRVEDEVSLRYQPVAAEELAAKLVRMERGAEREFTVLSSLAAITSEMSGVLRKVDAEMPEVARYLKAMDRKIELLGRALLAQTSDIAEQHAKAVNLSASGMAFQAPEPLSVGAMLELKLLLYPTYTGILIYAEVVACERMEAPDANGACRVRVNFTHLRESDRDLLIRHVLQRQSEMLRRQREAREQRKHPV